MKIVLINGSHRKGNTQYMLTTMFDEIKKLDPSHDLTLINLRQKNIGYAQQTDYNCSETSNCPQCCRDDMKEIFSQIEPCDMIILGSPIYFSNVSGKMKTFMDRCHAFYFNKKLNKKWMVVVGVGATQNNEEFIASFKAFGNTLGMRCKDVFVTTGNVANFVQNDHKTVQALKQFTKISIESSQMQM